MCDPLGVTPAAERQSGRSRLFAEQLFAPLPPRYERLAAWLSFGQNGRWRREVVSDVAGTGARLVLDVATGPGGLAIELAARAPGLRVVGLDITASMLRSARASVREAALGDRVTFVQASAEALPFPDESFDALMFTYLLRYVPDPGRVLRELVRVVKPGGEIASLEFFVPPRRGWRAAWWLYTRGLLPVWGRLLGGRAWAEVGRFLGPSISRHYRRFPLSWHVAAWEDAGATDVETRVMSLGGGLVMRGRKAGG